jgi:hypothetical protein
MAGFGADRRYQTRHRTLEGADTMIDIPTVEELVDSFRKGAGPDFDEEFATHLAEATRAMIRTGQIYYDRETDTLQTIIRN